MPTDEGRSRAMGIDMEELPKNMRLSALADRCMSEINKYRHGEASSDQYCLEIFRRAMLEHDDEAWTVRSWICCGPMLEGMKCLSQKRALLGNRRWRIRMKAASCGRSYAICSPASANGAWPFYCTNATSNPEKSCACAHRNSLM